MTHFCGIVRKFAPEFRNLHEINEKIYLYALLDDHGFSGVFVMFGRF